MMGNVTMKSLAEFGFAILLALVPSIVLYLIFKDSNTATFKGMNIELGGPAALFFIVLYAAQKYALKKNSIQDQFSELRGDLVGSWQISSDTSDKHTLISTCDIKDENGNLCISSGQFISDDGNKGAWHVDAVFLNRNQLLFTYEMIDAGSTGAHWKGLVSLEITKKDRIIFLCGYWGLIGKELHGTIRFTKL